MISGIPLRNLVEALKGLWNLLPRSPFTEYISYLASVPYLGYINWFIPMGAIIKITAAWCGAILGFYTWSWALRLIKVMR